MVVCRTYLPCSTTLELRDARSKVKGTHLLAIELRQCPLNVFEQPSACHLSFAFRFTPHVNVRQILHVPADAPSHSVRGKSDNHRGLGPPDASSKSASAQAVHDQYVCDSARITDMLTMSRSSRKTHSSVTVLLQVHTLVLLEYSPVPVSAAEHAYPRRRAQVRARRSVLERQSAECASDLQLAITHVGARARPDAKSARASPSHCTGSAMYSVDRKYISARSQRCRLNRAAR